MNSDNRDVPQNPLTRFKRYRKFGFVLTEVQVAYCPSCKTQLNAGLNYVPERCSKCGQLIDWDNYSWREEEFIKYMSKDDSSEDDNISTAD